MGDIDKMLDEVFPDTKPKPKGKVKISNKQVVTTTYDYKRHKVTERVVSSELEVPASSIKAKKSQGIERIEKEVNALNISAAFGNDLVTLVKNPKRKHKPGHKVKYKWYIEHIMSEQFFKRTSKTDLASIRLIQDMLEEPDEFGLEPEVLDELKEKVKIRLRNYAFDWPREVLVNDAMYNQFVSQKNLRRALEIWHDEYESKVLKSGSCARLAKDMTNEELARYLIDKRNEALKAENGPKSKGFKDM